MIYLRKDHKEKRAETRIMADDDSSTSVREHRKRAELGRILVREEVQARIKKITSILKKDISHRTQEELLILQHSPDVVREVESRIKKRLTVQDRTKEIEDLPDLLSEKCKALADAISKASSVVVYTGAGISTAASIPDYRGPNGVWTLLQKGKEIGNHELSDAEPTVTHMAIAQLYRKGMLSHVVSQNCDGLHLRSGLPRHVLSEVHGNMYIEVCIKCKPQKDYIRLFDVTERTSKHKHKTGRKCYKCGYDLIDTIVHFGEKGVLKSPLNWSGAVKAAEKCGLILCLGSSLKVLRKYACLWGMTRPQQERPVLGIVNLQWTPKDHLATIKINGKCDEVMMQVMNYLNVPIAPYNREKDPIFKLATPLLLDEHLTLSRKPLIPPPTTKKHPKHTERKSLRIWASEKKVLTKCVEDDHCYAKYLHRNAQDTKADLDDNYSDRNDIMELISSSCNSRLVRNSGNSACPVHLQAPHLSVEVENISLCDADSALDGTGDMGVPDSFVLKLDLCDVIHTSEVVIKTENCLSEDEDCKLAVSDVIKTERRNSDEEDSNCDSNPEDEKLENEAVKPTGKPGWFGKGYRKWKKRRRL